MFSISRRFRPFSDNLRLFQEISEDHRKFPETTEDFRWEIQKFWSIYMWKVHFLQWTDTMFFTKSPPNTKLNLKIILNIKPGLFSKKVRGSSVFRSFCSSCVKLCQTHAMVILSQLRASTKFRTKFGCFLVWRTGAIIQEIEKTLNNSHTTTQKWTNNGFRNTKKHANFHMHGTTLKILQISVNFEL